ACSRLLADSAADTPNVKKIGALKTCCADGMDASPRKRAVVEVTTRARETWHASVCVCQSKGARKPCVKENRK
ncbi:hypothetical protein ACLKMY_40620, partial [Paraburkholderia mimosarum]|uniref:hypothetical protein n=1 Tax=Paraburkholderia mimosarum TaxID=312026 RepID=UPI0039C29495